MALLGVASYGTAAAAFLILALLLAVAWGGRQAGARLILAGLVSAAWALALALNYGRAGPSFIHLAVVDWLRFAAWLFVLAGLARTAGISRTLVVSLDALSLVGVALALTVALGFGRAIAPRFESTALLASGIGFPLAGLITLEQLYRGSHASGRWALRPLFIGLGGMLVFDLFMYSEAMMAVAVSAEALAARGFINAACVPALALAARRNPEWSLNVLVSRQVVFYTTTFLVVGSYLLAMAAGGYLIAAVGGRWGEVAQLVFLAGGGLVLATLVGSDLARNRLRVFLNKHFYSNKYDYRVEWLRFVDALETKVPDQPEGAVLVRAVAQIVGSRFGALWILGDEDKSLVHSAGWSEEGTRVKPLAPIPAGSEFAGFLERRQWVVDLSEHSRSKRAYQDVELPPALVADHGLALIVPLTHAGRLVGVLGLGPPRAPFEITFEDRDLLKTVGRHVGTHLAQLESDRRLGESRQFEAYSRLAAFVMHDLKNLLAQLTLVVANADKHRRNPAFVDDTIDTIRNSTGRITRLIEQLQHGELKAGGRTVELGALLERVLERTRGREPVPTLERGEAPLFVTADPERLGSSIEHVVRNAQDATAREGSIRVRLAREGGRALVEVADSGAGMSADFVRERLFRPFDSTKGAKGMGIGAYQVRDYVRSLKGEVAVSSSPGAGTVFSISLPVTDPGPER